MSMKPWRCSICGKRKSSQNAVYGHARDVHKKPAEAIKVVRKNDDDDESYADRAIKADIDRAAGIYNPDQEWLLP